MKIIRLLLLLLLIFVIGNAAGAVAEQKESAASKAEQPFQVKLPDGLYLFQPLPQDKIYELDAGEWKPIPNPAKDDFSPLFIVKDGKLSDPYSLANKIGIDKFNKKYVIVKTFRVYNGTEKIGELTDIKLNSLDNWCSKEFHPNIAGKGKYNGKPLSGRKVDSSTYIHRDFILPFVTIKATATPQSFQGAKNMEEFTITEEDKAKAAEAVRDNFLPETLNQIKNKLKQRNRIFIGEEKSLSRFEFLKAIDLDGNGSKDIIGVYTPFFRYKEKPEGGRNELNSNAIFFVLWDTGKIEKLLLGHLINDFGLVGVIDIDQDGIQEVIIQVSVSLDSEFTGKQIEVFKHNSSGWRRIYQSVKICSQIY